MAPTSCRRRCRCRCLQLAQELSLPSWDRPRLEATLDGYAVLRGSQPDLLRDGDTLVLSVSRKRSVTATPEGASGQAQAKRQKRLPEAPAVPKADSTSSEETSSEESTSSGDDTSAASSSSEESSSSEDEEEEDEGFVTQDGTGIQDAGEGAHYAAFTGSSLQALADAARRAGGQ